MRILRTLSLLSLTCVVCAMCAHAPAQISVGVNIGPEPVCPYGYFSYPPYTCAPYGYYGPDWFVSGVFVGAGPWFHGPHEFWGHVDNRWDPHHGYVGPLPERGEHSGGFAGGGHAGGRR